MSASLHAQRISPRGPTRRAVSALALAFGLSAVLGGQTADRIPLAVVSAASFAGPVAPDSLASLFGASLTDRVAQAELAPDGELPLELDGVSVRIAGRPVGLIFVSPTQINFWLPPDAPIGNAAVEVRSRRTGATANGSISVASVGPGVFSSDCLRPDAGAILNATTFSREPFAAVTPSMPGDDSRTRLSIFASGIRNAQTVEALLRDPEGRQLPLEVEYAGPAPGFFGLDQINVVLTPDLEGLGAARVLLLADGVESNTVSVRLAPRELLEARRAPYTIQTVAGAEVEAGMRAPAGGARGWRTRHGGHRALRSRERPDSGQGRPRHLTDESDTHNRI